MGKSAKKANVAVSPAKSAKKGKRDADVALEKQENAKKIKRELEAVVKKPKVEEKKAPAKAPPRKVENSSSSEDESSSDDEPAVPVKKAPATVPKNDKVPAKPTVKESSSSEESDSSEESSDDEPSAKAVGQTKKPPAKAAKNGSVKAAAKKEESSDDSETESDSDGSDSSSEEDNVGTLFVHVKAATKASLQTKKVPAPDSKKATVVAAKKKANSSDNSSESEDESSEESDEQTPQKKTTLSTKMAQGSDEDDTSDDSDGDSSEDEPTNKQQTKKDTDVKMVDAPAPSANSNNKPQTPAAQKTGGSKTLFAGNLSYDVEKGHVEEFFKDCGEVVDVRLSFDHEGNFKGYGHVEFATEEVAAKALELNGQELLGREIRLNMAREKGAYTPQNSNGNNSFQKGGRGQSQSLFIRGFDKSLEEDQIRSSLEEHFGSCGEITRISVPKDYESGAPKGIAYMDFKESDGLSKGLELNGSELDGYSLTVEEARPKADGGSFSGGRSGGRGGRFGGRDGGGRFGGGRRGGGRGGGGRGRGTPYGSGKKKTFGDD
ncbi:Nucleolin 2 [Acorus calamus]|uniref:Nucleolin 2 n=1 Tax=Acorus calamus TaxID=4465 RepID=A0AAV9E7I1_ACOCL|nr:Nucleolin 2 [Acorus calamus]